MPRFRKLWLKASAYETYINKVIFIEEYLRKKNYNQNKIEKCCIEQRFSFFSKIQFGQSKPVKYFSERHGAE